MICSLSRAVVCHLSPPLRMLIYQIALGANGVALAAGNEAIAVASFALLGFVAFVASARK